MKSTIKIFLMICLFLVSSCFKTAEQIAKERQQEVHMTQSQEVIANLTNQSIQLQERIDRVNNKLEEMEHQQKTSQEQDLVTLKSSVEDLQKTQEQLSQKLINIERLLQEHKTFINEITKSLKNLNTSSKVNTKQSSADPNDAKYWSAMNAFKKKQNSQAKALFLELIGSGSLTAARNNHALHKLGVIEYQAKNYEQALVYLSKVYTKYPKSSVAPDCLYHIALSLKAMGNPAAAKESLQKFQKSYPDSNQLPLVQKALSTL